MTGVTLPIDESPLGWCSSPRSTPRRREIARNALDSPRRKDAPHPTGEHRGIHVKQAQGRDRPLDDPGREDAAAQASTSSAAPTRRSSNSSVLRQCFSYNQNVSGTTQETAFLVSFPIASEIGLDPNPQSVRDSSMTSARPSRASRRQRRRVGVGADFIKRHGGDADRRSTSSPAHREEVKPEDDPCRHRDPHDTISADAVWRTARSRRRRTTSGGSSHARNSRMAHRGRPAGVRDPGWPRDPRRGSRSSEVASTTAACRIAEATARRVECWSGSTENDQDHGHPRGRKATETATWSHHGGPPHRDAGAMLVRRLHVIAGHRPTGSSFYFAWLDNSSRRPAWSFGSERREEGRLLQSSGPTRRGRLLQPAADKQPASLPGHAAPVLGEKSTSTWPSGTAPLVIVYRMCGPRAMMADPLGRQPHVRPGDWDRPRRAWPSRGSASRRPPLLDALRRYNAAMGVVVFGFLTRSSRGSLMARSGDGAAQTTRGHPPSQHHQHANVFFVIIPGQKRMVEAMRAWPSAEPG